MTPHFYGSEPVRAESGKYKGTIVMQDEQDRGLAFVNALDEPRRKQAILSFAKEGDKNLTEAWKDNVVLDYAGIRATGLSAAQRSQLLDLIALYVGNMDDGHAKVKMADVRAHLNRTYFAWIWPHRCEQRVLLPHPQPGDPDRVRSPALRGHPAPDLRAGRHASTFTRWCGRRTATITARICCGSTTCSIRTDSHGRTFGERSLE